MLSVKPNPRYILLMKPPHWLFPLNLSHNLILKHQSLNNGIWLCKKELTTLEGNKTWIVVPFLPDRKKFGF